MGSTSGWPTIASTFLANDTFSSLNSMDSSQQYATWFPGINAREQQKIAGQYTMTTDQILKCDGKIRNVQRKIILLYTFGYCRGVTLN
jgi:hypothetical protein